MSVSVFEHPFLSGLLGEPEMARLFSAGEDVARMLEFEVALARVQGELGIIPGGAAQAIEKTISGFSPDMEKLNLATARDGAVIPELVRQLRQLVGEPNAQHVHLGATSQDVIDTSLILRLKAGLGYIDTCLNQVQNRLDNLISRFANNKIMARTRMQNALPSTVQHCVETWRSPLQKLSGQLPVITEEIAVLQLGGAIGDGAIFGEHYHQLAISMAEILNLAAPSQCWQTDRSSLANLANWLSRATGSLGKIGQDIAIMSINEIAEIKLSDTGSSSVMAHKKNPVKAEILVTLANFNATQLPAMHHSLVHENHRSGSAWTLEWMVLPQMMMATAASARIAAELLASVEEFGG